jgi:hypothetical protein
MILMEKPGRKQIILVRIDDVPKHDERVSSRLRIRHCPGVPTVSLASPAR